jgi:hypothetical protein
VTRDEVKKGLQAERTELAWIRTALTCGALSLAAAHLADGAGELAVALAIGVLVTLAAVAAACWRIAALRAHRPPAVGPAPAHWGQPALLAGALAAADIVVLGLVLT